MTGVLLAGAVAGLGVLLLVRVLVGTGPSGPGALVRLDADRRRSRRTTALRSAEQRGEESARLRMVGSSLRAALEARGVRLHRLGADLAVTGTSLEAHLATSALAGVVGLLAPLVVLAVYAALQGGLPSAAPLLLCLVTGVLGLVLPSLVVRGQAADARRAFRHVVGAFLDLVAMNLAGGRGVPEALQSASAISDAPAMAQLRRTLEDARLQGTTPWHALGELGAEVGVEELVDLASALALVAEDGAKVKESLAARAESLRRKELADLEGKAQERSQSMIVAQLLLAAGFLLFLLYPALARIAF